VDVVDSPVSRASLRTEGELVAVGVVGVKIGCGHARAKGIGHRQPPAGSIIGISVGCAARVNHLRHPAHTVIEGAVRGAVRVNGFDQAIQCVVKRFM